MARVTPAAGCLVIAAVAAVASAGAAKVYPSYRELAASDGWEEVSMMLGDGLKGPGGDLTRHLVMNDAGLPEIRRMYVVHVPDAYIAQDSPGSSSSNNNKEEFPVLWYFHGQGMNPDLSIQETDYNQVADHNNYFTVFPKGVGGSQDGGVEGTGWNVGTAGDDSTCTREAWSEFGCNCTSCYNSCQTLGLCNGTTSGKDNNCGWSTCYDDVAFVKAIIADLKDNFAIDEKKMFATGCSNGGMMTQYIVGQLPHAFRAAIPNYALPLKGYLDVPKESKMPFLAIYDRWDYTIPLKGGLSTEGWRYESLANVTKAWGEVHGCDTSDMVPWRTPQDGGVRMWECTAFKGCQQPHPGDNSNNTSLPNKKLGTVAQCLWDGYHGDWPADGVIAKMTFWWIKTHVLGESEDAYTEPTMRPPPQLAPVWVKAVDGGDSGGSGNNNCSLAAAGHTKAQALA